VAEIGSAQADAVEVSGTTARPVGATSFLQRAVIRRRVRFLRRSRELALHDLGGFTFEVHRLGEPRDEILAAKLAALRAALIEGEESGPSTPFDFEAFIARKRNEKPTTV